MFLVYKKAGDKVKKAGIITMHYANNYGAVLQCYALRKKIKSLGVDADVLNFVHPAFPKVAVYNDNEINFENIKRSEKFDAFRKENIEINAPPYYEWTPDIIDKYNYFITGSDQIWNPRFTLREFYFLDFAPDNSKKISYAPSIARPISNISPKDIEVFRKFIPRFDHLSVREKTHEQFIQQFTDKKVQTVLDPTMLLNADEYREITALPNDDKYILLYFLNHDFTAPAILSFANKIAIKYGLKVKHSFVEIPGQTFKNDAESFRFSSGPKEFLGLIKNAEIVITNSFHAAVFSIIFNKPFYSFVVKSMSARMYDLLGRFGLSDRIIEGYKPLNEVSFDVDYSEVNKLLDAAKTESINFIKDSLC